MNYNFYADTHADIKKGDIVIKEDGELLMLNWNIQQYINAKTTQAITCNHKLKITRHFPAKADRRGIIYEPEHDEVIVNWIPCVMSEYAGRPDYQLSQNSPGIHPDMLTVCDVQYNAQTSKIDINDTFEYGRYTYRVIHIDQTQVVFVDNDIMPHTDSDKIYGIIRMYCRQVAGDDL